MSGRLMTYGLVLTLLVTAAVTTSAQDAGQESPFVVGLGARALGLGGSFVSLADDASVLYYNPAGLPALESQEASLMHMRLFEGTSYNFAGWVYPDLKLGGFGLGYMRIGTDDIIRRSGFIENGTFDYAHSQFLISYGQRLQGGLSVGLSFKLVNQSIEDYSDYAFGFDLGMLARLGKYVSLGAMFRDIVPPELELNESAEVTPISVVGGLTLRDLPLSDRLRLVGTFEVEKIEARSAKVHTGAEIALDGRYAVRVGYDRDNLAFGAGVRYNRVKIDYAYKMLDYLEDSHRFSLSFLIGTPMSKQREQSQYLDAEKGTVLLEDERRRQFEFYKEQAQSYYNQFRLDSALVYYQRALAFDEGNEQIIGMIAAIENSLVVQLEQQQKIRQTRLELQKSIENYFEQAENFFAKKYYPAALDMLDLIFDINPNYLDAVELRQQIDAAIVEEIAVEFESARRAETEKNAVAALESYNRILELDPDNRDAAGARESVAASLDIAQQLNRGIELYNAGDYNRASATFGAVLLSDRQNPVAIEYLKRIESLEDKPTTLEDLYRDRAMWQLYLDGLRFMRDKEYEKAIEAWNRVLEKYPNNVSTLNNIEQARLRLESEESN